MHERLVSQWQTEVHTKASNDLPPSLNNIFELSKSTPQLKWSKMGKIGQKLYPSNSPHGKPTKLILSSQFLFIGTLSSEVLIFDKNQDLVNVLTCEVNAGGVNSMCLNSKETHLAIGFNSGSVALWDLESPPSNEPRILYVSVSTSALSRTSMSAGTPAGTPMGTPRGTPGLTSGSTPRGMSVGSGGTPVGAPSSAPTCHNRPVKFIEFLADKTHTFVSIDDQGVVILNKLGRSLINGYYCMSQWLLGSYTEPLEVLGVVSCGYLVAILTTNLLEVIEIKDDLKELLTLPRTVDAQVPSVADAAQGGITGGIVIFESTNQLVYAWGNHLKSLNIQNNAINADCAIDLPVDHQITQLLKLNDSTMLALTSENFLFLNSKTLELMNTDPIPQSTIPLDIYASSGVVLILGRFEFFSVNLTSWSDRLLNVLNNDRPSLAMELALALYTSNEDLSLLGLPKHQKGRQNIIRETVPNIVFTALRFGVLYDQKKLPELVPALLNLVLVTQSSLLEDIWDEFAKTECGPLIVAACIELAVHGKLNKLPPDLYKKVLEVGYEHLEVFYNIDVRNIDLDLAFKLCELHNYEETKTYLEVQCLKDYTSCLKRKTKSRYVYLAYTLTSRVFPTGQLCTSSLNDAKKAVYKEVFFTDLISELLKYDEKAFFTALNEAFEDPFLNESSMISRQIIMNLIVSQDLKKTSVYYPIFVATNNPKYKQYLVIPDSVLKNVMSMLLTANTEKVHCQLAIMSLLGSYKISNEFEFQNELINAGYTLVLARIFKRQNKLCELVSVMLNNNEHDDVFKVLNEAMIDNKPRTINYIKPNFSKLLNENVKELAVLVAKHGIDVFERDDLPFDFLTYLYSQLLKFKETSNLPPAFVNSRFLAYLSNSKLRVELHDYTFNLFTNVDSLSLPLVVDVLIQNNDIDILATLLCRLERYNDAVIYLVNYLPQLETDSSEFKEYLKLAISICEVLNDENAWERLLECCLKFKNLDPLKTVIDSISSSSSVSKIVKIVTSLLISNDGMTSTKLLSVVRADLKRQERILNCFDEILHSEGENDLLLLLKTRIGGYVVPNGSECEVCGDKVVGIGIDADLVYKCWEQRSKTGDFSGMTLVVFRCSHIYHLNCLTRMNGNQGNDRKCIVCYAQS